jgi:hypothetical protein
MTYRFSKAKSPEAVQKTKAAAIAAAIEASGGQLTNADFRDVEISGTVRNGYTNSETGQKQTIPPSLRIIMAHGSASKVTLLEGKTLEFTAYEDDGKEVATVGFAGTDVEESFVEVNNLPPPATTAKATTVGDSPTQASLPTPSPTPFPTNEKGDIEAPTNRPTTARSGGSRGEEEKDDNTTVIIAVVAIVVVTVILIAVILMRRKSGGGAPPPPAPHTV